MYISAAIIIKTYLERYVAINLLKTKNNLHSDQLLARRTLNMASEIITEMDLLIMANRSNDFKHIKTYLKRLVADYHEEMQEQEFYFLIPKKTQLPSDFGRCLHEAWEKLHHFERQRRPEEARRSPR